MFTISSLLSRPTGQVRMLAYLSSSARFAADPKKQPNVNELERWEHPPDYQLRLRVMTRKT